MKKQQPTTTTAPAPAAPTVNLAPPTWHAQRIALDAIVPNPDQPRDHITPASIAAMADSLQQNGLLEPVLICRIGPDVPGARFVLIAGERRWRGAQKLKWTEIDARVAENCSLAQAAVMALVENLQREDLNALQEARGLAELVKHGLTHEQIGVQIGRDKSTVTNALRLLKLPASVQQLIGEGKLTARHGLAILRFDGWPRVMEEIGKRAAQEGFSADRLRTGLPFFWSMEAARPMIVRTIREAELIAANVTKKELQAQPWFFADQHQFFTLDPEKAGSWLAERQKAHETAEREKAAAALAKHRVAVAKAKAAGKPAPKAPAAVTAKKPRVLANGQKARTMTAAEKRDRADTVAKNRTARAKLTVAWTQAQAKLKALTAIRSQDLATLADWALSEGYGYDPDNHLAEACGLLGIQPAAKKLEALTPLQIVQVSLFLKLGRKYREATRYSGAVPADLLRYSGKVKLPAAATPAAAKKRPAAQQKRVAKAGQFNGTAPESIILASANSSGVAHACETYGVTPAYVRKLQRAQPAAKKPASAKAQKETQARALLQAGRTAHEVAKELGIGLPMVLRVRTRLTKEKRAGGAESRAAR